MLLRSRFWDLNSWFLHLYLSVNTYFPKITMIRFRSQTWLFLNTDEKRKEVSFRNGGFFALSWWLILMELLVFFFFYVFLKFILIPV